MMIFLCVLIACLFIVYIIRIFGGAGEAGFATRGILSGEKLGYMLSALAFGAKQPERGNGISLRAIKKKLYSARKTIAGAKADELYDCESGFIDNFDIVDEALVSLRRQNFRYLPHVHKVPRLYELCELLVKSVGGVLNKDVVQSAVRSYCAQTPLNYDEICALGDMLTYAVCEYLSIYAHKLACMREKLRKAKKDASEGKIDHNDLRYAAYVYGYGEIMQGALSSYVDEERRREDFLRAIADYNSHIISAVGSLRELHKYLSDEFIVTLSPIYDRLRKGDHTFDSLSLSTKALYLREIADKAKKKRVSEKIVADEMLYSAASSGMDISYFILPGRMGKSAQILYAAIGTFFTAAVAVAVGFAVPDLGWLIAIVGLSVWAFAVSFACRVCARFAVKRRYLPAYAEKIIDPDKSATTVLLPCYIASTADIDDAFDHLGTVAAANPESIFSYCLMIDYPQFSAVNSPADPALDEHIRMRFAALGKLSERACVIVRKRKKIAGEEKYRGYEKKRGAVMDFNRYVLRGEGEFSLRLGQLNSPRYAVVLDSDTLTSDCMELVCTKAHPYCKDVAVLSLRCAPLSKVTPYARLFAGETGPGRYRYASESVTHNLFGIGNFTGKGIYDISLFDDRLGELFPDNRILSHDFVEGAAAGCMDSQMNAGEDFPQTFSSDLTRRVRWLRGDWQLLPYIFPHVRNKAGKRIKNPLPSAARFSIAANLMLSLLAPAQFVLLIVFCFFSHPAVVLLALSPQILRVAAAVAFSWRRPKNILFELARTAVEITLLPTVAVNTVCAVAVTLYRLSAHRKLLEWQVFAHAHGKISLIPNYASAAALAVLAIVFTLPSCFAVAVTFALGAVLAQMLSVVPAERGRSNALKSVLYDTAQKTFGYFSAQEDDYLLPCDCYQEDGSKGWCARTSPTDIGMALVAYCSAYELGLTDKARLISYIRKIVESVEKCEKYHGNLYNWYDCNTLEVLPRRFVSSVDSGNFLASLILASTYTVGELNERINLLIDATDLSALFDNDRKLFYIGYDEENRQYTYNHYDLLGSESSLTYLVACGYAAVPKKAFHALDRAAVRSRGETTVYSWTGGAFEYLMSRLFIAPDGTLYGGAMEGAAKIQQLAGKAEDGIWGISECRYNEFDDGGGNLYRAFGVREVARSSLPESQPFAPYAAFLTLPYVKDDDFVSCVNGYVEAGAAGEWGFYDSLDGAIPVRSYMTHHQGMILAACANAVKNDCIVNRMQTLPQMRAAKFLCGEEKTVAAYRRKSLPTEKADRSMNVSSAYICRCGNFAAVASRRKNYLNYDGKCLLRNIDVTAKICDGRHIDLMSGEFFAAESALWQTYGDGYVCESRLSVMTLPLGAALSIRYRNLSDTTQKVEFVTRAEPVLTHERDYEAHPAYSKMFLATGACDDYVWARRKKGRVTAVHSLTADTRAVYTTDKCEVAGRGRGNSNTQNINPILSSALNVEIESGKTYEFFCYYLVADSMDDTEHVTRLAATPDCAARNRGASVQLSRSVPELARTEGQRLLEWLYDGCGYGGVSLGCQSIAVDLSEVKNLPETLAAYKYLYETGFEFNLLLYCRERRNAYPEEYFDCERAIELSGIRRRLPHGSSVQTVRCDDGTFRELKAHAVDNTVGQRVSLRGGKLVPYTARTIGNLPEPAPIEDEVVSACGMGGFTAKNGYFTDISNRDTPAPWCNIMSDGRFGTLVTESGGGYTFGENSRQYKITEWSNDPVEESVSELIAIDDGNRVFGATKMPLKANANYATLHARGYTLFICDSGNCRVRTYEYVVRGENRKIYRMEIQNKTNSRLELHVIFGARFVLGDFRRTTLPTLSSEAVDCGLRVSCRQSGYEAYLYGDRPCAPISADIVNGELELYDAIERRRDYWGIAEHITLGAEEVETLYFALSSVEPQSFDEAESLQLREISFYDNLPQVTFDGEYGYLTEWLPYQVYNSRFRARTGFYQVSGAYGFRDQLQDCLALLYCKPELVREHILECARHQFREGDVQHWWHPPAIGVRTHVCDDRLWLVYVACEYVARTGDNGIWREEVPFLEDVPISSADASVYAAAKYSTDTAPLLEHCLRAVRFGCDLNEDGLVRMRGGDWNDAMDKVGEKGEGASVWCTMFLYAVIRKLIRRLPDTDTRLELSEVAKKLYAAVISCFEDDRFLRAVCDDGRVLGSRDSSACKVDLLTQSWCVLADIGNPEMRKTALSTVRSLLCDDQNDIIRLFDPPFTSSEGVGYIGDYPEYVRENGGQYTQAAVWYVMALFENGDIERANELLEWLSPAAHSDTLSACEKYCVEPYVSPADVYGGELAGKGGWTWYTGSAAWLYKCLLECYAGIKISGDVADFQPKLPKSTKELNVKILFGGERIRVKIINSDIEGKWHVRIGSVIYNTSSLKLTKGLVGKDVAVVKLP